MLKGRYRECKAFARPILRLGDEIVSRALLHVANDFLLDWAEVFVTQDLTECRDDRVGYQTFRLLHY